MPTRLPTLLLVSLAGLAVLCASPAAAQPYAIVIKGGHVIDPKNGRDAVMDVAIVDGKIAEVAAVDRRSQGTAGRRRRRPVRRARPDRPACARVSRHRAGRVLEQRPHRRAAGQPLVPQRPDDARGRGRRRLAQLRPVQDATSSTPRAPVSSPSSTSSGPGMKGGPAEQNLSDMDAKLTAMRIRQHPGVIVGIKVAHYNGPEWDPVDRAVQAGTDADVPVMIDFGGHTPPLSLDALLNTHLRPGDILTHMYAHVRGRSPIVNAAGPGRAVRPGGPQARRHLRRRPRRRQLPVAAGRSCRQAGLLPRRRSAPTCTPAA